MRIWASKAACSAPNLGFLRYRSIKVVVLRELTGSGYSSSSVIKEGTWLGSVTAEIC